MPRKNSRRNRSGRSRRGGNVFYDAWNSVSGVLSGNKNNGQYDSGSGSGYDSGSGSNYNMGSGNSFGGRKRRRTMKRGGMPVPYAPSVWDNQSPFPKAVGGKRRKTRRMRKTRK